MHISRLALCHQIGLYPKLVLLCFMLAWIQQKEVLCTQMNFQNAEYTMYSNSQNAKLNRVQQVSLLLYFP